MKKIFIAAMLAGIFCLSCKKEGGIETSREDSPELEITIDGADGLQAAASNNAHSLYSFGGVAGTYYGCTASFTMGGEQAFDITFGTSLTSGVSISDDEMLNLLAPGPRTFGSLGSFSSYPGLEAGKVEIAFTDKKGKRWCSTKMTEKLTPQGLETDIFLDQRSASFIIDEVKKINTGQLENGFRLKGHFECFLYEVNGDAKKKIKGKFKGMVGAAG